MDAYNVFGVLEYCVDLLDVEILLSGSFEYSGSWSLCFGWEPTVGES